MKKIESYKVTWRPADDAGMIHLALAGGTASSINVDSAAEAAFLTDLLRNESPVFFDPEHELIGTGFEEVGEGEQPKRSRAKKKS